MMRASMSAATGGMEATAARTNVDAAANSPKQNTRPASFGCGADDAVADDVKNEAPARFDQITVDISACGMTVDELQQTSRASTSRSEKTFNTIHVLLLTIGTTRSNARGFMTR